MHDLVIVGGGPAGLTSGIYATRRNLKTLLITEEFGGAVVAVPRIENYPGFKEIDGLTLMKKMEEQARGCGVEFATSETVREIFEENGSFILKTEQNEYRGKAIILAFGKSPKHLGVPGEDKFENKGVSFCVNCDGPLFRDENVCVIGGGNSALDAALVMSDIAKKVYLIHRRNEFRGFESMVEKVRERKNVEFILNSVVKEFRGDSMLKSVLIENLEKKEVKELEVAGAFVEIGSEVKTDFVKNLVKLDENNHIIVDERCQTFYPNSSKVRPGVFAAGDVTNNPFKQIVVATGQGAIAALQAYNYIKGVETKISADWGHGGG